MALCYHRGVCNLEGLWQRITRVTVQVWGTTKHPMENLATFVITDAGTSLKQRSVQRLKMQLGPVQYLLQ